MKSVILECSVNKCPRKKKIDFDKNTMPKNTVKIISKCPWHQDGDFDEEEYLDKNNKQIMCD